MEKKRKAEEKRARRVERKAAELAAPAATEDGSLEDGVSELSDEQDSEQADVGRDVE